MVGTVFDDRGEQAIGRTVPHRSDAAPCESEFLGDAGLPDTPSEKSSGERGQVWRSVMAWPQLSSAGWQQRKCAGKSFKVTLLNVEICLYRKILENEKEHFLHQEFG